MKRFLSRRWQAVAALFAVAVGFGGTAHGEAPFSVTTYHYDSLRTGWNRWETTLTPANVHSNLSLRHAMVLDDQVDAQPLVVTRQTIGGLGKHDALYVATENNTIYAFDASTGAKLLGRNLGMPVPASFSGCNNNAANIGIGGTPVIDLASGTLYVIAYVLDAGHPTFRLHALDLGSLADKMPARTIAASRTLSRGGNYQFHADVSRQRSALLLANGNVYAGFASYCDSNANFARGWVLGWNATTLDPLPGKFLGDRLTSAPEDFFLTSIWMSGWGPAADQSGNLYFVTGNSDPSGATYRDPNNLAESAVKLSSDLTNVLDSFTPGNFAALEADDFDFGSGGITLLPNQTGPHPRLAVAAGKDGNMYLLDRDDLGGFTPGGPNRVLGTFGIGGCWCGESYFTGADGLNRIVSSGGADLDGGSSNVMVWRIATSPRVTLKLDRISSGLDNGQDGGFMTSVSSNGVKDGIIWAVARPNTDTHLRLYAFDANTGSTLTVKLAGVWPNVNANANVMPVVANGLVYVASYKSVQIFGLGDGGAPPGAENDAEGGPAATVGVARHAIHGTVLAWNGSRITIETRAGRVVTVDSTAATRTHRSVVAARAVLVRGDFDAAGVFQAQAVLRAKTNPGLWRPDR